MRPDVETDVSNDASDIAASRLLAARSRSRSEIMLAAGVRKTSALRALSRIIDRDFCVAGALARIGRPIAISLAASERTGDLSHLHRANLLADGSGRILSASR